MEIKVDSARPRTSNRDRAELKPRLQSWLSGGTITTIRDMTFDRASGILEGMFSGKGNTAVLLEAFGMHAEKHSPSAGELAHHGLQSITNLIVRRPYGAHHGKGKGTGKTCQHTG